MRNKAVTIIIVIATVLLAGVAIFTAVRLYQLREESVSPAAPESAPEAALRVPIPEDCTPLTFTITPKAPGMTCSAKKAYEDDPRNEAGTYYLVSPVASGSELDPGEIFVYTLSYENTGTATVTSATFTDTLPPQLDFMDSDPGCTVSSRVVTCTIGEVVPGGKSQKAIRVQVADDASSGNFTNTATLEPAEGDSTTCSFTLEVSAPGTPTPTPSGTPTPTPSGTPTPRSSSTPTPSTITQATPIPSTPAPALPEAGIPTPTLVGLGAGSLLLLLAILALAL